MSKKITKEEFLTRFNRNYPEAKINLINYTAISNSIDGYCELCGKSFHYPRARNLLNNFNCCGRDNKSKLDILMNLYKQNNDFDFVKKVDKDHFIVRHNVCGNEIKRVISNSLDNPFACKYCDTSKTSNMLSISEVQEKIDSQFGGTIKILDYNGQLKKNHYKCLKCGLIFTQQQTSLMMSRGCPKCDRTKSLGERFIRNYLEERNLDFKEQVQVKELPLQRFDFCVYKNNSPAYYIEVQGEQHFEKREIFRDSLEKIQERDERKRKYCREYDIPLYELIYKKGKFKNLDILPD